ncbi:MAG: glycosyltransferase family 39 protein [Bacteroidales bacterium]|nr:glycosyltransferase family 39 protein [Bacteroidales bacterium]
MILKLRQFIRYCFDEKPLLFCMWSAFLLRMLAVVFSQGIVFGFDHYMYVENAQKIVSGEQTFSELVFSQESKAFSVHGYSLVYLIVNTGIFYVCEIFGMFDARTKMFIIRLFHALFSLLMIYYGYRITYRLANRKAALVVGLVLSMLWFMPFVSVKSLPENLSSIFLLAAVYRFAKTNKRTYKYGDDLFVGLLAGGAVPFCYNSIIFVFGFALAIALISNKRRLLLLLAGATISVFLTEGIISMIVLKAPFYILGEYASAVFTGGLVTHGVRNFYMYISLLIFMIPMPWGLLAIYGYVKSWKRTYILFFPVTFYIVISYILPYKGEQFILPIVPLFFIVCLAGWYRYTGNSRFWAARPNFHFWLSVVFFVINTPALFYSCFAYTRKAQVETMLYLSRYKNDITSIMVEDSGYSSSKSLPLFYLGKQVPIYVLNKQDYEPDPSVYYSMIKDDENTYSLYTEKYFYHPQNGNIPQYVIFYGDYDIPERLSKMRQFFPQITYEKKISPSFADRIIQFINPGNRNVPLYIYKTCVEE